METHLSLLSQQAGLRACSEPEGALGTPRKVTFSVIMGPPGVFTCGRGFSRHRGLSIRWRLGGARTSPHAPVHRLDEPTGVSLGMVASPQWPPPFRPARLIVAPQWRVCRFSTSGWPVIPSKPRPCQNRILSVIALVTRVTLVSRKFGGEML